MQFEDARRLQEKEGGSHGGNWRKRKAVIQEVRKRVQRGNRSLDKGGRYSTCRSEIFKDEPIRLQSKGKLSKSCRSFERRDADTIHKEERGGRLNAPNKEWAS